MSKSSAVNVLLRACDFPNRFESCLLLSCLKNLSIESPDIWLSILNKRDIVHNNNNSNSNKSSTIISARKSTNDKKSNIINNSQTQNSGTHAFSWKNFISQVRSSRLLASSPEESVTKVSNTNAGCHSERDAHQGGPCSDRGLYNHEVPIVRVLSGGLTNKQWVINNQVVLRVTTKQNKSLDSATVHKLSASSNFSISSAASSSSSSSACSVENPAINGPQGSFTVERAVLASLSSLSCKVHAEGCCQVLNSCAICDSGLLCASFFFVC